ncbi:unnamed protein product [Spirodela intermedia]|uniref:Protein kinase domain-containing protein n=1 Tax=Spirodela intermedia TaxID=51605 RepID=A0A7I8IAG9_SPIIN|nr:unnamed protein product [Spirodela intermedia]CAA6654464.1 unnamed protein product [Spirodela intermedia]
MQIVIVMILLFVGSTDGKSDFEALLEFKNGIKEGPPGRLVSSWNTESLPESGGCPSSWYGIQCSGGRIISITLSGMNLVGEVNLSALTGMEMLVNLSLSHNHLSGILLPEAGSFKSLEFLDLSDNSFVGGIPAALTEIESLVYLNLSLNNFSGRLPAGFRNLWKLAYLDLRSNGISGDVERSLLELQVSVRVDFSRNAFTGSLRSVPENSSLLGSIQYLNISHNKLSGELFPDVMPLFDSLEVFDASHNQLEGQVPAFNFIVSLRVLRLRNNRFSGSLPETFLEESSMTLGDLDLSNNQLEGPVKSITSGTLIRLNLSFNKLSGSLPLRVGSCASIDLSSNMLSGNLSRVRDWGNYVEAIDLSSNSLEGMLPNETSLFLRLVSFKVSNNSLHGELPFVLGTYPELQAIDFSLNKLYGSLPSSLFTSLRLSEVKLSGNSFTGSVPLRALNLTHLDLSDNSLSGSLPAVIGALKGLKLLNVSRNNFSGIIPPTISNLHSLQSLDLSGNNLVGGIPSGISEELVAFNVSYNNLSGIVPHNLLRFPNSSFHPGNPLLILPRDFSLNGPNLGDERRREHHHIKPLIRNMMIVGFVGAIFVMILLSLLIYYRTSLSKFPGNKSLVTQGGADPPPSGLPADHGVILSTDKPSVNNGKLESTMDFPQPDQIKSGQQSPLSLFASSPYSRDENSSEQPSIFKVRSPDKLAGDLHLLDSSFVFTAEELSRAPAEIIGRSCHGTTYRATLDGGHVLAVKWLREGITKGRKEFSREVKKLGNIRHPNIISLRGYYWGPKDHEKLIISDYFNAECLTLHLCEFEPRKLEPLSPTQRLGIAIDVARGLNYLHNQRAIPHGNLKSTNIIIITQQAPALNALLSDYSLHRIMNPAGMAEQVLNAGALGYRPPEFACTSKPCPSLKSDVYAFGVILLELLTGKNAGEIVSGNPSLVDLTDWVKLLASEHRSAECFDKGTAAAMEGMLQVALRCIRPASERPEMGTVFEDLRALAAAPPAPTLYMTPPPS